MVLLSSYVSTKLIKQNLETRLRDVRHYEWDAEVLLFQSGALSISPGTTAVIVPIPILAMEAQVEISTSEEQLEVYEVDWSSHLYVLEENIRMRIVKGQMVFLFVRYFSPTSNF
jgi:hypothetical protein